MFRLQARELYPEVRLLELPESMKMFRENAAGLAREPCATNLCHGGEEAGRLQLFNRKPNAEASVFTNFLILDRFTVADRAWNVTAVPKDGGR